MAKRPICPTTQTASKTQPANISHVRSGSWREMRLSNPDARSRAHKDRQAWIIRGAVATPHRSPMRLNGIATASHVLQSADLGSPKESTAEKAARAIVWHVQDYIEPPLPPAPPSMRKARSRQSLTRSLAPLDRYGATGCCLTCDRRLTPSAHLFKQALWPWQRDSHAVSPMAALLAATTGLTARRQTKRALRMKCSFWVDASLANERSSSSSRPIALCSSIFPAAC